MTDADFEMQKERVRLLSEKWIAPLGLKLWQKVDIEYWREQLRAVDDESLECAADCHADWRYLLARIRFCLPLCAEMSDDQLEYIFVHECCHVLVNEMHAEGMDHEERVVTQLAMVMQWVWQFGAQDALRQVHEGKKVELDDGKYTYAEPRRGRAKESN